MDLSISWVKKKKEMIFFKNPFFFNLTKVIDKIYTDGKCRFESSNDQEIYSTAKAINDTTALCIIPPSLDSNGNQIYSLSISDDGYHFSENQMLFTYSPTHDPTLFDVGSIQVGENTTVHGELFATSSQVKMITEVDTAPYSQSIRLETHFVDNSTLVIKLPLSQPLIIEMNYYLVVSNDQIHWTSRQIIDIIPVIISVSTEKDFIAIEGYGFLASNKPTCKFESGGTTELVEMKIIDSSYGVCEYPSFADNSQVSVSVANDRTHYGSPVTYDNKRPPSNNKNKIVIPLIIIGSLLLLVVIALVVRKFLQSRASNKNLVTVHDNNLHNVPFSFLDEDPLEESNHNNKFSINETDDLYSGN